jgi:translation initiation factor IF-2
MGRRRAGVRRSPLPRRPPQPRDARCGPLHSLLVACWPAPWQRSMRPARPGAFLEAGRSPGRAGLPTQGVDRFPLLCPPDFAMFAPQVTLVAARTGDGGATGARRTAHGGRRAPRAPPAAPRQAGLMGRPPQRGVPIPGTLPSNRFCNPPPPQTPSAPRSPGLPRRGTRGPGGPAQQLQNHAIAAGPAGPGPAGPGAADGRGGRRAAARGRRCGGGGRPHQQRRRPRALGARRRARLARRAHGV